MKTLPALREVLRDADAVAIFGGNMAENLCNDLVRKAAGDNLAFREALFRKLELLRAELAGPTPSPVERLLAERVTTCWLWLHDLEIRFVQAKNLSISQAEYHQQAIDRAHRRYLVAIRTLALVRKLALPVLQVNIAKKQVNMAGPCVTADSARNTQ